MNVISPKLKFVMKIVFKPITTSALLSDDQKMPTLDSFWYMTSHIVNGYIKYRQDQLVYLPGTQISTVSKCLSHQGVDTGLGDLNIDFSELSQILPLFS